MIERTDTTLKSDSGKSLFLTIFDDWRVGRFLMFILITGSITYGLGGSWLAVAFSSIIGLTLSISGFYLDYLFDYKKDIESGKISNPIARGTFTFKLAVITVVIALIVSITLGALVNPWVLIPMVVVMLVIIGLGFGILDSPFLRAISLGLLQGLYVLIGAFAAEQYSIGVWYIALFLFFAMTGGRAMGDTRDLPHDVKTNTMTIPKKFGVRIASIFLLINELIAYTFGFLVYFSGILNIRFLYCMIVLSSLGFVLSLIFAIKPTPKVAYFTNMFSFMLLGLLFVLGMILGKL
ncbi:MAG: UbiA family prenyltransferase [Candidatus Thorarchaeota archaeon]